jgi:hypothetical protein
VRDDSAPLVCHGLACVVVQEREQKRDEALQHSAGDAV